MPEESTTPDLVELTRGMFEASSTGSIDGWMSFYAPDVVWESVGLGTSFEGLAEVRGFLEVWTGRYEEYEIEPREILDLGNGVVFAVSDHTARPVGSAGDVRLSREVLVHAFVWEDGMITRVGSSGDTAEARAAAERLAESRG
jgi:ketosteroid isomerase-like protein